MKLSIALGAVLLLSAGSVSASAPAAKAAARASAAGVPTAAGNEGRPAGRIATAPRSGAEALSRPEVAEYFDNAVPGHLATDHVPGLSVSVVQDGRTIFSQGYGLANVDRGTPFDPAASLVRIASISKLFTWTAVMQLVQAGRLDLRRDVNDYLTGFRIPDTYPGPVTLEHLMSHTAGFEDRAIGIGARSKADVPPLATYLAAHVPARVRPAGEMSAYSNYGAALAGHIVSRVSGQPYEQYVQDHILGPLGMQHSTATEPVPARLVADQAASYDYAAGAYRRIPFIYDKLVPDGSISATADDMARFMAAHLQDGRLGEVRLLAEPTARLMHRRSFAADPRLDGYAHGFKEKTVNGHPVIMHDGSWEGFQSALMLVPDRRLGLFISANSTGGIAAVGALIDGFFDRFLPAAPSATPSAASSAAAPSGSSVGAGPEQQAGFYRLTRSAHTTVEKLLNLGGASRVRVRADGQVLFQGKTWQPIGPDLYQEAGGSDRLAFVTGRGSATYLATDGPVYERVAWRETPPVNLAGLGFFGLSAISAVLGLPVVAAVRRWRRRPSGAPALWRTARWLAAAGAALGVAFLVLLAVTLAGDTSEFLYAPPLGFRALLILPIMVAVLGAASAGATAAAWRQGPVGVLARLHQVVLLAGLLVLTGFFLQWNLFGWRFG